MPLSEQEQRLLEEMERSLYQNDADFVATVNPRRGRPNYTILVIGALIGVLGIATLVAGVVLALPIVGILGFVVMFVGVLLAVAPPRRFTTGPVKESTAPSAGSPAGARQNGSSFMDRLNERWDQRQQGQDPRERD